REGPLIRPTPGDAVSDPCGACWSADSSEPTSVFRLPTSDSFRLPTSDSFRLPSSVFGGFSDPSPLSAFRTSMQRTIDGEHGGRSSPPTPTSATTRSRCGDVHLTPADLECELAPASDEGSYAFSCPVCEEFPRRPANARVVSVLLDTGVKY